jgi:glycosyltransferase involved in cell wall biosynthesis
MRIVVDVSPLSHPRTGIGNYLVGLVGGLAEVGAGDHVVEGFAPTSLRGPGRIRDALAGTGVDARLWPLPWSHAVRVAWSRLGHPAAERLLGRFDALLFSDWMYPPQRGGLRATVVHDLVPVHHPEWCTPRTVSMHVSKYENAAATCDLVLANSSYTASDVVATLGVPADRVAVARPGIAAGFTPGGEAYALPAATRASRYVLGVGTLEPRKNLVALAEAWRLLDEDVALVLAGGEGWGSQAGLDDPRIVKLGYVPHEHLPALYRGAAVFAFPSLMEGFGIPVVEAMACGTPVVASAHPSLDDAAGTAALRADPRDPAAIADRIRDALARADELRQAGLAHASRFRWEETGRVVLEALEARR